MAASSGPDLRTLDGRWYHGKAELGHDSVIVTPRGAEPVIVPLSKLKSVQLTSPEASDSPTPRTQASALRCTVVLIDGSKIVGSFSSLDAKSVQIMRLGQLTPMKMEIVARVQFVDELSENGETAARGHPRALLASGDLFEGDLRSCTTGQAVFSSVLFGNKAVTPGKDLLAILFADIHPGLPSFRVRASDGSVFQAKVLRTEAEMAVVEDGVGNTWKIPVGQLTEIDAVKADD